MEIYQENEREEQRENGRFLTSIWTDEKINSVLECHLRIAFPDLEVYAVDTGKRSRHADDELMLYALFARCPSGEIMLNWLEVVRFVDGFGEAMDTSEKHFRSKLNGMVAGAAYRVTLESEVTDAS